MRRSSSRLLCRLAATLMAAVIFLAGPLSARAQGLSPASAAKVLSAPSASGQTEGCPESEDIGESFSFVELEDVDCFIQDLDFPEFDAGRESFSVVLVLGFALERPAAVHRPPWA